MSLMAIHLTNVKKSYETVRGFASAKSQIHYGDQKCLTLSVRDGKQMRVFEDNNLISQLISHSLSIENI